MVASAVYSAYPPTAMGEATAREARRAARRLIGDQGVRILEAHSAALNEHARSLTGLTAWAQSHTAQVERHEQFIRGNWRSRLRWLMGM